MRKTTRPQEWDFVKRALHPEAIGVEVIITFTNQADYVFPRRWRRARGWVVSLLVAMGWLFSRKGAAGAYLVDAWDSEQGLPDNYATSLAQTPDGYLWLGTYGGLARFDGDRFVTFNRESTPELGHSRIVKLFVDGQGTLWINTYDGSLTTYRHGVFRREWNGARKGVSGAWLVADNAHEITFSFRSGLLITRTNGPTAAGDWRTFTPPVELHGVCYREDASGSLWGCTVDGQLWRIIHNQFVRLALSDAGLRGNEIHWLTADAAGHIWVGTEKELAVWDGRRFLDMTPPGEGELNVASLFFTKNDGLLVAANGRLRQWTGHHWGAEFKAWPDLMQEQQLQASLHEDRQGGLWRTSRGLGLFHIRPDGTEEQLTLADGLPGDHTTAWLQDREGNVWVTLANAGVARLRPNHFQVLAESAGLAASPAISVCEDHAGALWVGTYGGGLFRWQNDALTHFHIPAQTPGDFVFSIYPDARDQLWLSAGLEDAQLFEAGHLRSPPASVHAIKCLLIDRRGRVWMGRKDGVECWTDGELHEWSSHTGSISQPVRALTEDRQGVIWMGADDGNIYWSRGGVPQAIPLPPSPAHQAVWSLLADADGSLWIGTSDAGLLHFDAGRFTRFTARDGLPDDLVCQLLDDHRGNLWLGTHHGIGRISKASLRAFATGQADELACSVYDRSDGLPTQQCSDMYQPSAWRGHDGRLWFATAKGVVGVKPETVTVNPRPPAVVIEKFLVNGDEKQLADGLKPGVTALKIPPGRQNFEFHYTALSLSAAGKIRFRYQLVGFDRDWINAGHRRWVQYNYLKPGRYSFRVAACNNDGVWNETGAALGLEISPYFWQTWWFATLLGLTLATGVAGAARHISHRELRRELKQLERQRDLEHDRARIARDIHDHVGSGLTRINLLGELLLCDPAGQHAERVGQITGAACELMRAMDEIVWAVDPKNDSLDGLMSYLCDYAGDYLRLADIRLRLELPTPLPAWPLTSEVRHNLFLAVKEVLNNIVKHSQASEVALSLRWEDGLVTLAISDNGRGLAPAVVAGGPAPARGNGLDNLRKRAAVIGGRCLIRGEPGRGTRIEFTLPAQKHWTPPAPGEIRPHPPTPPKSCPSPFPSLKMTPPRARD